MTYSYGNSLWGDQLTAVGGKPITYDGSGNPLTYDGWSYTWQGGRQLAAMSKGSTNLSFEYNESGLRTQKTVNGTTHTYTYMGNLLVADVTANDALYFHYDAGSTSIIKCRKMIMVLKFLLGMLVLIPTVIALFLLWLSRIIFSPMGEAIAAVYPKLSLICLVLGCLMLIPLLCSLMVLCVYVRKKWREKQRG